MYKYEAMFILKAELSKDEYQALFQQIQDAVTKNNGEVVKADIWSEKRKLYFTINKYREGLYYLMRFNIVPTMITPLTHTYKLNESILRVLISRL